MSSQSPNDIRDQETTISLDVEPTSEYTKRVVVEIAREKARTERRLALILVLALVCSLPVYYVALYFMPQQSAHLSDAMDKWFTVLGPLAGAAVGIGYIRQSQSSDRSN